MDLISVVKRYWQLGLATLPTKEDKSPVAPWKQGITDLSMYNGCHGIGIVCGQLSGNLECMDFDNHFGDAKDTMSDFMEQIKEFHQEYKFPIQKTKSGGYHLIYRCETIDGNQKLASKPMWDGNRHRPDAIIETRGEGGYFVVAPTENYRIIRNSLDEIPVIPVEVRSKIISIARSFNKWADIRKSEVEDEGRPGDRFNNEMDAGENAKAALREAGWTEFTGNRWVRPGKNGKKGISATFGYVDKNIFHCFTSNGHPFEPGRSYTPFQVVCLLKHSGDFHKFAKELAEKYNPDLREKKKGKKKEKDKNELDHLLSKAIIDLRIPVEKPPDVILIKDVVGVNIYERRLFTLGNFSAISGKSKSKKTFLTTMLLAAAVKNGYIDDKFVGVLPEGKRGVILFDTEQSNYDAWVTANRVTRLIGGDHKNFHAYDLREYEPIERCQIIDYALGKYHHNTGLVVIDGIADLANQNNDELEGTRVTSLLMKWTKVYNLHICNVIHQNKGDNYATGHLGSYLMKKSECIISVEKSNKDHNISDVKCDMIRGVQSFENFSIQIDENGLPRVFDGIMSNKPEEIDEAPF